MLIHGSLNYLGRLKIIVFKIRSSDKNVNIFLFNLK